MTNKFDITKIKLIVGLGNVGEEYLYSRHNAGFLFLDAIVQNVFINVKKVKSLMSETSSNDHKIIVIKPTTMMNDSGEAVSLVKNFYKFNNEEILVIHDDLDLKLGEYKIQFDKKPKVHNGIESVEKYLGSGDFWRIRIGVDNRDPELRKNISGADYVLGRFSGEELNTLKNVFREIVEEITA